MAQRFLKDPDEILDYTESWATELGADTISTSTWTVPSGLANVSSSNTTTTASIFISGGTAGNTYTVTNRIVTAGGRTMERSIYIRAWSK